MLKHYVGIYDPASGELQLVPARSMVMRSVIQNEQEEDEDAAQAPGSVSRQLLESWFLSANGLTVIQARVQLGEAFGTKKSQKMIRSLTENRIAPQNGDIRNGSGESKLDAAASAIINAMPETSSIPSRKDLQAAIDEAKPVRRATCLQNHLRRSTYSRSLLGRILYGR